MQLTRNNNGVREFLQEHSADFSYARWDTVPFHRERPADHMLRAQEYFSQRGENTFVVRLVDGRFIVAYEPKHEEAAVTAVDDRPTTWRGLTPIYNDFSKQWVVEWKDFNSGIQTVASKISAQDCIQKLKDISAHPIVAKFLATLPPEEPEIPTAPVAQDPVEPSAPVKFLRPGDRTLTAGELPERPTRAEKPQPNLREISDWWNSLSAAEAKKRYFEGDDAFRKLIDGLQVAK